MNKTWADQEAEEVVKAFYYGPIVGGEEGLKALIAEALRNCADEQVMKSREADDRIILSSQKLVHDAYDKGFEAAKEAAAKVCWDLDGATVMASANLRPAEICVKKIRALKPEGE